MQTLPMTRSPSTFDACFRHGSCIFFPQLLLLALAGNILGAANPSIAVQVSSETAPPGGYAQFKVSLTTPTLVSSASVSMTFDPAIFGNIASVAAFSATGDQTGFATLNGAQLMVYFSSSSASLGQLPDLPVLVVTVPVLATAKPGATSSITIDPTQAPWHTGGATASVSVNPGTFTVGGAISIQNVTPGGGLLPSGTVVTINGTGFDATTTVAIDGVSLASTQLISAQQINVALGGATEMTGKHMHVANPAGASVDYFAALSAITTLNNSSLAPLLPSLPPVPQTSAQWDFPLGAGLLTDYSCLQNPSPSAVTATYYYSDENFHATSQSAVIPPYGLYIASNSTFAIGLGTLYMTSSAPLRMAEFAVNFYAPPAAASGVNPVQPVTALGAFGIFGLLNVPALSWQLGTPAPQPVVANVRSGFPFSVSISSGAAEWLQVTPASGGSGTTALTLTPIVSALGAGTYTGTVTLTENLPPDLAALGSNTTSFTVTLNASPQPTLVNANGNTQFIVNSASPTPAPSVITLTTNGTPAPFTASITPVSGGNWLSVTPSSGTTPGPLTLTANPTGLASGIYNSNLIIQGP